jgi:hypothetical protein
VTMSVIDLGDVSYLPDEPEDYPGGRREFGRVRVGRLAKAAIAAVAALVLGGSGLPAPPVLRQVWSVPYSMAESMMIEGDSIYVRRATGTGTELTAYDLGTGAARWTRDTGPGPAWLGVDPQERAGVVLVPGDEQTITIKSVDGSTIGYSYAGTLTALDPATGEPLWRRTGAQYGQVTGDTLLMYERSPGGMITWLRLVRTRDGSTVWERRAPENADVVVVQFDGETPERVVTGTQKGELTVLRYADGTPVVAAPVPWRPTSYDTGTGSNLSAAAGRVVIVDTGLEANSDRSRVTVYRTDDLVPLWSRDTIGWTNVQECGPLLCVGTAETAFEAVDPDTGTKRWGTTGGPFVTPVRDGERLLVAGTDDEQEQTLVDAATGRVIGPGGNGNLLYQDPEQGTVTLLRDLGASRSAVNRLDTTTGQSTTLGVVGGGSQHFCIVEGDWIACATDGGLVVTAVG